MPKLHCILSAPILLSLLACSQQETSPPPPAPILPPPKPQTTCPNEPLDLSFGDANTSIFIDGLSTATDPDCNLYLAGAAETPINLGAGPIGQANGKFVFIAKFDPQGKTLWSKALPKGTMVTGKQILALDKDKNLVIGGTLSEDADFGGGFLGGDYSSANFPFLLGLDNDGNHRFSLRLEGNQGTDKDPNEFFSRRIDSLALDADGNILIAGTFTGDLNLGGQIFTCTPWDSGDFIYYYRPDAFIAKYTPTAQFLWAKSYGGQEYERHAAVGVFPNGNALLVFNQWSDKSGAAESEFCFGSCMREFAPDGTLVREKGQGDKASIAGIVSLVPMEDGGMILGAPGTFEGSNTGEVPASAFVVRLDAQWNLGHSHAVAGTTPDYTQSSASVSAVLPDINDGIRAAGYFENLLSVRGRVLGGPAEGVDSFQLHTEFLVDNIKATVIGGPDIQMALSMVHAPAGAALDAGADIIAGVEGPLRYYPMSDPPQLYGASRIFVKRLAR